TVKQTSLGNRPPCPVVAEARTKYSGAQKSEIKA
ncbi:MAG: hypothetical protein ACI9OO_001584, partial [Bacteroidia bacterium]